MSKIFISYRRDDSQYVAQVIYHKLADHYGEESVIFDVDTIPIGCDFGEYLNEQVAECDVLLAIIGQAWLDVRAHDGSRRIDDPKDFVRIEIQAALKREIPVMPVLVGGASMPAAMQLPPGMETLSRQNATEVRPGRDFQPHLERLVRDVVLCFQGRKSIGVQLKLLEPGTFLMGEGKGKHQVTLTEPFRLGIYPVTQAEYEGVIGENPSQFKGEERRPVEYVFWFEAIEFCNRLSEQEGRRPYYDVREDNVVIRGGVGYRLPTEAEWEYACRAGGETTYCFGDDRMWKQLHFYAWFHENSGDRTHAVGEKQPNAWGLYDMHGNVWEWCSDWYGKYATSPEENPIGPSKGSHRVSRGGSWYDSPQDCRSAYRYYFMPSGRYHYLGFRVARSSSTTGE